MSDFNNKSFKYNNIDNDSHSTSISTITNSTIIHDNYNQDIIHKTILVGDSGVGKTSILVQFDQGKFQSGSFSATVGIGFTSRLQSVSEEVRLICTYEMTSSKITASNQDTTYHQNMDSDEDVHFVFKVMSVGDSGVGKTCLIVRFKDDTFLTCNFIATVGIDFKNKIVNVDNRKVKLQIWDTAGQERFRSVTHAYYRDAQALMLLYDVTSQSSFDNIRAWLSEIRQYADEDIIIMLLGNKVDKANRVITKEQGEKLAKQFSVSFMETSAKTGQNVELAFTAIARALIDKQLNSTNKNASDPKSLSNNGGKFNLTEYLETNKEDRSLWCCSGSTG